MKKIKPICVVGAGYWGKNHIKTLNKLGVLGGVVEKNKKLLTQISKEYPNVMSFDNLNEAIKIDKFSGFTVAAPPENHFKIAEKIIKSRKHVLVEKPITLNLVEAEELCKLSKEYNVHLMVGHILLFHPAIIEIKRLIDSGKIGDLQYVYSNRLNLGKVRTKENVFWSLAPHDIALFQYFTESFPCEIQSWGSTFLQKGIFDSTITKLCYPTGVEGHIFVSWLHPFKEHRLVVIGSEGMLSFDDSAENKPLKLFSKKINFIDGLPEKIDGPVREIVYDKKLPLTEEMKHFLNVIKHNKPNIADGDHAVDVIKILIDASNKLLN